MTRNILNFILLLFISGSINAATVSPGSSFSITHDFSADTSQPTYTNMIWGFNNQDIVTPTLWQQGAKVNISLLDNLGNNVSNRDYANPFSFGINNLSSSGSGFHTSQTGTLFTFILTGLDATFDFSTLYFRLLGSNGLTEQAIYVPSAVPIPAAAFLFAPALLGFMGLRRQAKNTVA